MSQQDRPASHSGEPREEVDPTLAETYRFATIGRLLAAAIHEINTPIGSIKCNNEVIDRTVQNLRKQLAGIPGVPQKVNEILENLGNLTAVDRIACERISSIVRSLRSMARSGPGEFQRVDLHAVLNDALKLAAAEFRNRIRVNADFGQLPEVECSPQAIGQVFLNILVNAGQAISGEGTVTVRSRRVGEAAEVSIADTGPGIPQEIQDRIFTPGFTTKPLGSGMGLGLKIAREIIEDLHGGTLRFESRAGSGTTFFVTIPVRRQPDGQKRSSP